MPKFNKVTTQTKIGDSPIMSAGWINGVSESAQYYFDNFATSGPTPSAQRLKPESAIVKVKNVLTPDTDLKRGHYIQLGKYIVKRKGDNNCNVDNRNLWFEAKEYKADSTARIGIIRRAAKRDEFTSAQLIGICTAVVNITDIEHAFADVEEGTTKLQSANSGPAEIISDLTETGEQEAAVLLGGGGGGGSVSIKFGRVIKRIIRNDALPVGGIEGTDEGYILNPAWDDDGDQTFTDLDGDDRFILNPDIWKDTAIAEKLQKAKDAPKLGALPNSEGPPILWPPEIPPEYWPPEAAWNDTDETDSWPQAGIGVIFGEARVVPYEKIPLPTLDDMIERNLESGDELPTWWPPPWPDRYWEKIELIKEGDSIPDNPDGVAATAGTPVPAGDPRIGKQHPHRIKNGAWPVGAEEDPIPEFLPNEDKFVVEYWANPQQFCISPNSWVGSIGKTIVSSSTAQFRNYEAQFIDYIPQTPT